MRILKHLLVVLLPALGMTYWMYSYKPRNFETGELIFLSLYNYLIWVVIFGVLYMILLAVVGLVRYLLKRPPARW